MATVKQPLTTNTQNDCKRSLNAKNGMQNALNKKRIFRAHPLIPLIYFLGVAIITMVNFNPIIICISFVGAVSSTIALIGVKKLIISLAYTLPFMLMIAIINPIFVHKGETILFFLNEKPFTLQAVIYGGVSAVMLAAVFYWFKCYTIIMTSDKIVYLFGRIVPKLSLIISMSVALSPRLKRQHRSISLAQKTMGMYTSKSITDRVLGRMRALNALIGYSLESGVQTADSMNARGYGLSGRTSFAIYRVNMWVVISVCLISALIIAVAVLSAFVPALSFYPVFSMPNANIAAIASYITFALLSFYISITEIQENIKWRCLTSKI